MANENEERVPIEETKEEEPVKLSRRDFLIGAGTGAVVVGAAAGGYMALRPAEQVEVASPAALAPKEAAPPPVEVARSELPATMRTVSLNIDGKSYETVVDVRESLWETMTYKLGLGSRTNLGCDRAQCGACGVAVDGRSMNACSILSARLGRGQEILTVYGLTTGNSPGDLHPIQQAYLENLGVQCAICSRGFIMSTYALLSKNLNPTEDEVRRALEGNICRCGNYTKIFDSVAAAAEAMRAAG